MAGYERRPGTLRDAFRKLLHNYGAPLGMFLFFVLAALYVFMGRGGKPAPEFPRTPSEFMQTSKAERRLAELRRRIEANPDDMAALAESGRIKYQLGESRYIEAIADLEKARSLGLADARTFFYLGSMYQAVGLYDFAAQEYRRFLNNYPDDAEARMLLAKLCYSNGDFPGAIKEYERLLTARKDDPVLLENLALARWKNSQDYQPALAQLRSLGASGVFLADYAEGRIAYESKDYQKAQTSLERAGSAASTAGSFADLPSLFRMAADAAWRNNDYASAERSLGELLRLDPGSQDGRDLAAKVAKARAPGRGGR